ncbi:lactoylglutathione lyase, partial [Mesorhizobium sp. M00.F.Ca.ET.158.01.1.1]
QIGDPRRESQMLIALTADSKDDVNAMIEKGVAAGGRADPNPAQDLGFMFNRHIEDPDGNVWEFLWMSPAALQ